MRFGADDWRWADVLNSDTWMAVLWAALLLAAVLTWVLSTAGCQGVPRMGQTSEQGAEVTPATETGDAESGDRAGPESDAEAGRDLRQSIRDMSEQMTDLSTTIEQHTTTIQETVQSQQSGRSELSGQVAEAVDKIDTLQQRVETLTDNSRQVRGLQTDLGQVSEKIGSIESMVQKTESTVQNYGISQQRLELEREQNRRLWRYASIAGFVLAAFGAAAFAADGPQDWWGKLGFFAVAGVLLMAAVAVFFGG